ncbi:non-canonical purine NTP pyrophosphatase [Candidatus Leptofilum sp.]|uniref:non-canonical purine NTP pyrophosphatase n=1 Tax=Candidatus Leptofilum sp. TaxID=3241576 RepID=UPI003B5A5B31
MTKNRIDRLYFVTASQNKFNDYQFLLGKFADLFWFRFNIEDVVTTDLDILIRRKVESIKPMLPHLPFLVEQTNLIIHAWGNLPGNVAGLFMNGVGAAGICKMLEPFDDRAATAVTKLAYHAPDGRVHVYAGTLKGTIAAKSRGHQIFGWDTIFIPNGHKRTLAEMGMEQRNNISTRKLAVAEFYTAVLQESQAEILLQNRIRLRELMVRYFNKSELKILCADLGIDQDELPNATKSELAQEIILYCERHGRLDKLLEICRKQRPHADWPEEL